MSTFPLPLVIAALLVLAALAAVAAWLWWRVRRLERERSVRAEALALQQEELRMERERGLVVIARALLADQVGVSEACLRFSYLMDALEWSEQRRQPYGEVDQVAQAVAHIPTHTAWKALPPPARLNFEVEMVAIEERHGEGVRRAAERLVADLA